MFSLQSVINKEPLYFPIYIRQKKSDNMSSSSYSGFASFKQRQEVWEQAVKSTEQHAKLGQTLQGQAVELLKTAQTMKGDPAALAKLIQQVTATIDKGVTIERAARDKMIDLYQHQPKDKENYEEMETTG